MNPGIGEVPLYSPPLTDPWDIKRQELEEYFDDKAETNSVGLRMFDFEDLDHVLDQAYQYGLQQGKKEAVERALELNTETLTMPDGMPSKVRTGKNAHKWIEEMLEPLSTITLNAPKDKEVY